MKPIADAEQKQGKSKTKFNETNENIEWAKWTWNPVVGCKHGCPYCYARDIATRFYGHFNPTFYPERLSAPENTKVPDRAKTEIGYRSVFVCSMADLFGEWVPQEWIYKVIDAVRRNPQWNFLFLTKNPERYLTIEWPPNAWIGATVDRQSRVEKTIEVFKKLVNIPNIKFISCEPLRENLHFDSKLAAVDWLIIGGWSPSTRIKIESPQWEWVQSILNEAMTTGIKVYCKPNLPDFNKHIPKMPKEYPYEKLHGCGH